MAVVVELLQVSLMLDMHNHSDGLKIMLNDVCELLTTPINEYHIAGNFGGQLIGNF